MSIPTRFEMPRLAWNDRINGVQVSKALSGKIIIRVDSLPRVLDKDAFREAVESPDATWATPRTITTTLSALFMRRKIDHSVVDSVLEAVAASIKRFEAALPQKRYLKTERQLIERAKALRFDPMEIKADIDLLKKGMKVFYNVVSAPVQELFDVREVFRRATSERDLVLKSNNAAALQRRSELLPGMISHLSGILDKDRARVKRIVRALAEKEARLDSLRAEQVEVSQKLETLGRDC